MSAARAEASAQAASGEVLSLSRPTATTSNAVDAWQAAELGVPARPAAAALSASPTRGRGQPHPPAPAPLVEDMSTTPDPLPHWGTRESDQEKRRNDAAAQVGSRPLNAVRSSACPCASATSERCSHLL